MARIAGVDIPRTKHVSIALTYIYGIGRSSALDICRAAGVEPDKKVEELTPEEVAAIRDDIQTNRKVEGSLRHRRGLPVRGQRTRTNARTRKGPKGRFGRR